MNIIVAIILFIAGTLSSFSQKRDSVLIQNEIYKIVYSEVLEQPKYIKYTVKCPDGNTSRSGMNFYKDGDVHTSDDEDYENNVWDKGHCAPAADFNCTREMLNKTFSYVNCVLQHEKLNRGVWRLLEEHERELAKSAAVTVEIKVDFCKRSLRLSSGATVPDGFWKMIYINGKLSECYYFNNDIPREPEYTFYKIKCKK